MTKTIQTCLQEAKTILASLSDSPNLEAECLLSHILLCDRLQLRIEGEKKVSEAHYQLFSALLARRLAGEPLAYLLGEKEFWSLSLKVTPDTLIPRADTECLIEAVFEFFSKDRAIRVLDLGTGSGAIALALAKECPLWELTALDASAAALKVAKENAVRHQLHAVRFLEGNWFSALEAETTFHLIVSNPPYLDAQDPHLAGEIRFEPKEALVAKQAGYADLFEIIEGAKVHLLPGGCLILEHGYQQAASVRAFFEAADYKRVCTRRDLAGHERVSLGFL